MADKIPIEVRGTMNTLADKISDAIPANHGFVLLVFELDTTEGSMSYISNAERASMIQAMEELLGKWRGEQS